MQALIASYPIRLPTGNRRCDLISAKELELTHCQKKDSEIGVRTRGKEERENFDIGARCSIPWSTDQTLAFMNLIILIRLGMAFLQSLRYSPLPSWHAVTPSRHPDLLTMDLSLLSILDLHCLQASNSNIGYPKILTYRKVGSLSCLKSVKWFADRPGCDESWRRDPFPKLLSRPGWIQFPSQGKAGTGLNFSKQASSTRFPYNERLFPFQHFFPFLITFANHLHSAHSGPKFQATSSLRGISNIHALETGPHQQEDFNTTTSLDEIGVWIRSEFDSSERLQILMTISEMNLVSFSTRS